MNIIPDRGLPLSAIVAWSTVTLMLALAFIAAPKDGQFLINFAWYCAAPVAALGLMAILRIPAACIAGSGLALLTLQALCLSLLLHPQRGTGFALALVFMFTMPGAILGSLLAGYWQRNSSAPGLRKGIVSFLATVIGTLVSVATSKVF